MEPTESGEAIVPVLDGDYSNEHLKLFSLLVDAMEKLEVKVEGKIFQQVMGMEDSLLAQVLHQMHLEGRLRTVQERFLDPKSPQYLEPGKMRHDIEANPDKVNALNANTEILNTTEDPVAFRQALREAFALVNKSDLLPK